MTIEQIIREREITEVLHFTTNKGLLGIFHTKLLKSRQRVPNDKQLEYIFSLNAAFRKDTDWLDFINLSISRINQDFFEICSQKWHIDDDIWWCVLAFDPIVMTHPDVFFTTTNNIYTGVNRGKGSSSLEALFSRTITQWDGRLIERPASYPKNFTTCSQAEVLYPGELSTEFLKKVYIQKAEHTDEIRGYLASVEHQQPEIEVKPKIFTK